MYYPFAIAIVLLAVQPVVWLVQTWVDPAYQSHGLLVALLVAALLGWSLSSPRLRYGPHRRALILLLLTAGVRLLGQLLGVNVIGAVALVLDLYAVGLLLGLSDRQRPLAPGWLALLFAFALPLERIIQRTIGFGLQHISATGACQVLSWGPDSVQCQGVRIVLAGQDVLVDLPCSGARGLLLLLMLFTALAVLLRPRPMIALLGLGLTLSSAVLANIIRIVLLALGLAHPEYFGGVSVMEAPWHEAIGVCTLFLGALPVLVWARYWVPNNEYSLKPSLSGMTPHFYRFSTLTGSIFLLCALVIVTLPARPVDVARRLPPPSLPLNLAGFGAVPTPLSAREQGYFTRYGGSGVRAAYGPYGLLLVSTSAPLRHLHAPDECLSGNGHRVRYLGIERRRLPSAIYRSSDPQGRVWRVAVTFISDRGELATSVSEAVWRWFQHPGSHWTMIQRISPWHAPATAYARWEIATLRALDLPSLSHSYSQEISI